MENKIYAAIDLKSFYASVECAERSLDPLTTNLVVADASRTEKTICLAVSPSLKAYGIPGRARLFEVVAKVKEANDKRKRSAHIDEFTNESYDASVINSDINTKISYIVAKPRMGLYMKYSSYIYSIYLRHIAPESIISYSVDECFFDLTPYLKLYNMTPKQLVKMLLKDVFDNTKITATAGIGTNLYLAKVAMDIEAKHAEPDIDGARIAQLDEFSYRKNLWSHTPITDFWQVGKGYKNKLESVGLYTMGDIALCSVGEANKYYNEDLLYKLFGIKAQILIDHAWGYEPTTIEDIKAYKPKSNSLSSGQVLPEPYEHEKARLIVQEMADQLVLDLVKKGLYTDQIVLHIGYDIDNINKSYKGAVTTDHYGRKVPSPAHGSINLGKYTSSTRLIMDKTLELFDTITDEKLLVRRVNIIANHTVDELKEEYEQISIFTDFEAIEKNKLLDEKERKLQMATLAIHDKYGKNALLKGMNFKEGGTMKDRNQQIGGHKA